jgi:hypothetical protein
MNRSSALIVLISAVVLSGCSKSRPTVVLDGWSNRDFAKEYCSHATEWLKANAASIAQVGCQNFASCPELTAIAENCLGDPTPQVRDFETQLATEFATDPTCRDVNFVRFYDPAENNRAASAAMAKPHWSLSLQFAPGAKQQPWEMLRSPEYGGYTKGVGRPAEIARKVCSIVTGRGAALRN